MKHNLLVKTLGLTFITALMTSSVKAQEIDYKALSDSSVTEFINFSRTPRLGFHLEKVQEYLKNWASKHSFEAQFDTWGNVWFDVPATEGCESLPKIILQCHMDMIAACKSGDEDKYDFTKDVGNPYYVGSGEDLLLKGDPINLGADDGAGVGMILAIANPANKVKHGPLRLLLTANEDYDMSGAENVDASILDGKYLINDDSEDVAFVTLGCSGGYNMIFEKSFSPVTLTPSDFKKVTVSVAGLRSGHSGEEIWDTSRLSAAVIMKDIITKYLCDQSSYNCYLSSVSSGKYDNAIAGSLTMTFAVNADGKDNIKKDLEQLLQSYHNSYSENLMTTEVTVSDLTGEDVCYEKSATTTLKIFFSEIPQGIVEQNETGRVTKSNNIGITTFADGSLSITCLFRSDFNEWLQSEAKMFEQTGQNLGMTVSSDYNFPAWQSGYDSNLAKWAGKYFEEAGYTPIYDLYVGGLEPTYFCQKNPDLKCISVGPTVDGAHTIDEALHVATVVPVLNVITKLLANADNLDNDPTAINEVNADGASQNATHKFIKNDKMYIIRNGKLYNSAGTLILL